MKDEPTWKQQCREYSQLRATKGVPITGYDDGGEDGFENVYEMLDQACEEIARKLKR